MKEENEIKTNVGTKGSSGKIRKDKDKKGKISVKPFTKVVVRRLPPTMTEETFLKQIDPIPDHDDFYFVPADWSLLQNASCRAYINFKNQSDIFIFKDKFDGYVFVDSRGSEYPAVVEFAPLQELPRNRSRKKDIKANSIETDAHYLSFLETLKNEENDTSKGEIKLEYSYQLKEEVKITTTPLLDYLANKKQTSKDGKRKRADDRKRVKQEERQKRRNNVMKSIPPSIKEEDKEEDIVVRIIPSRLDHSQKNKRFNEKNNREQSDSASTGKSFGRGSSGNVKENRDRDRDDRDRKKNDKKDGDRRQNDRKGNEKKENDRRDGGERKDNNNDRRDNSNSKNLNDRKQDRRTNESKSSGNNNNNSNNNTKDRGNDGKKEIKKYSERRKETRARAECRITENSFKGDSSIIPESKTDTSVTSTSPTTPADEVKIVLLHKPKINDGELGENIRTNDEKNSSATNQKDKSSNSDSADAKPSTGRRNNAGDEHLTQKMKDDRVARKIRNKDRPTIALYQPGSRNRGNNSNAKNDDEKPKSHNSDSEKSEKDRRENYRSEKRYSSRKSGARKNLPENSEPKKARTPTSPTESVDVQKEV